MEDQTNLLGKSFNEKMRTRTMTMAVRVFHLFKSSKKVSVILRPVINQIVRSSTSVAANFSAATRARSEAEFFSKLCIVTEECDETLFWLDFLRLTNSDEELKMIVGQVSEFASIKLELNEQIRIFSVTRKNLQEKMNQKKKRSGG